MYLLYPRLPLATAEKLACELASLPIRDLSALSGLTHDSVQYSPTGGNKVQLSQMQKLQHSIRECAQINGYPEFSDEDECRTFDIQCSVTLHQNMFIHPSEASHREVWVFMTCILLPDIVRWRFPGESTSLERFIGSDRGLRRNTFGRLWWRAFLLYQPQWKDSYALLHELVEDDLVQVTERNSIAASPTLLSTFCISFLHAVNRYDNVPRRMLIREAAKRLRRLLSLVSFDALDATMVSTIINDLFSITAESLIVASNRLPKNSTADYNFFSENHTKD